MKNINYIWTKKVEDDARTVEVTRCDHDLNNRRVINFDYLREWTQDNINELVAECIRMREMDITHQGEAVTAC